MVFCYHTNPMVSRTLEAGEGRPFRSIRLREKGVRLPRKAWKIAWMLERFVEGAVHVKGAGYVGWGDDDREGRSVRVDVSVKQALFKPEVVPFGFRRGRVVDFRQGWDAHVVLRAGALLSQPGCVVSHAPRFNFSTSSLIMRSAIEGKVASRRSTTSWVMVGVSSSTA